MDGLYIYKEHGKCKSDAGHNNLRLTGILSFVVRKRSSWH